MTIYNQTAVLNKLNRYLALNHRDIKLNGGFCHGFTLLWLYKMSHGDEEWFYETIKKIVHCRKKEDFAAIEIDIEKMIANIRWLQNSKDYIPDIQQLDVDKILELPRELNLSFLFRHGQLNEILEKSRARK